MTIFIFIFISTSSASATKTDHDHDQVKCSPHWATEPACVCLVWLRLRQYGSEDNADDVQLWHRLNKGFCTRAMSGTCLTICICRMLKQVANPPHQWDTRTYSRASPPPSLTSPWCPSAHGSLESCGLHLFHASAGRMEFRAACWCCDQPQHYYKHPICIQRPGHGLGLHDLQAVRAYSIASEKRTPGLCLRHCLYLDKTYCRVARQVMHCNH